MMEYLPVDPHPPPPPINDVSLMGAQHATVSGAVTIRPLAFDHRSIPSGRWELEIAWTVLGPDASLPPPERGEWVVVHVISSPANAVIPGQRDPEILDALTNDGDKPVVALVIRLRAAD